MRQGKTDDTGKKERNDVYKMIDRNGFYKGPLNIGGSIKQQALTAAAAAAAGGYLGVKKRETCARHKVSRYREILAVCRFDQESCGY